MNTRVPTFTAQIYTGLKIGYDGSIFPISNIKEICQSYCDSVGFAVTITPTEFVYTGGNEPGAIIGLINYPRFPSDPETIKWHAEQLAGKLKTNLKQSRVTIVFPDYTLMLGEM